MKRWIAPLAVASVLGAFWLTSLGQAKALPKLVGTTGPAFKVEVTKAGKDVKQLKAGAYSILVRDRSAAHNFHLIGPGVSKKTGVAFVGTKTWTVTLKKGTYTYRCDVHYKSGMKGSFKVV